MTVQEATRSSRITQKPQVAIMNAVHDLPVLAARDLGYFKDEGLDIDFVTTPGMAQVTTKHFVKFDSIFDRPLDSTYNEGVIDIAAPRATILRGLRPWALASPASPTPPPSLR